MARLNGFLFPRTAAGAASLVPAPLAELVTMRGTDVELGPAFAGDAEIELFGSPVEELTRLAPREMIGAYYRSAGATFTGGVTLT